MNKQLTIFDVEQQAQDLIEENGQTTTLDIKKALREQDFWATQDQVATGMYLVWEVHDWHWVFNGTFRTYFPNLLDAMEAYNENPDGYAQTSWLGWLAVPEPDDQDDDVADDDDDDEPWDKGNPTFTDDPQPGDWMTFSYSGKVSPAFVTGFNEGPRREDSRNLARQMFSVTFQVDYLDTGADRVK